MKYAVAALVLLAATSATFASVEVTLLEPESYEISEDCWQVSEELFPGVIGPGTIVLNPDFQDDLGGHPKPAINVHLKTGH